MTPQERNAVIQLANIVGELLESRIGDKFVRLGQKLIQVIEVMEEEEAMKMKIARRGPRDPAGAASPDNIPDPIPDSAPRWAS